MQRNLGGRAQGGSQKVHEGDEICDLLVHAFSLSVNGYRLNYILWVSHTLC